MSERESHAVTESQQGRSMGMRGCATHEDCTSTRPGHGLHRMQARLVEIAASKWVDGIVTGSDDAGFLSLATLDGGSLRLWHHEPLGLEPGTPVAYHRVYGVLHLGVRRISVADA